MDNNESEVPLDELALTVEDLNDIMSEIENQPKWRAIADKEADYADGNQLDSAILQRMMALGVPPAIEDIISPTLMAVEGYELVNRTDWRVTPNNTTGGDDVAEALSYKLNESERHSKADAACSAGFRGQITTGIGWVEVKREPDPFKYPYACLRVPRNEIFWDMRSRENDLSDARWLRRSRWVRPDLLKQAFPHKADEIDEVRDGRMQMNMSHIEGGQSTGLNNSWVNGRPWTEQEENWYNPTTKEIELAEVWYRRNLYAPVLFFKDGRVVEYDEANDAHNIAITTGFARVKRSPVTRLRRSYWIGDICLHDEPTPYPHNHFPYVPFWGFREDNTNIPYGFVRRMKYSQDAVNSGTSKMRWGMSVVRVERTKGAVMMSDAQLRDQISRPDADIILNQNHMAQAGSKFEVHRDYTLSEQHLRLIDNNRAAVERVSGISLSFQGQGGTANSGRQEGIQVEQSNQSLAKIMQNFKDARTMVGELLIAMIVEDIGTSQEEITIQGDALNPTRTVVVNRPEEDELGYTYLSNDVQRTRILVALEDVPTTSSFRAQQLNALSEVVKSVPDQVQVAMTPFLTNLMDIPDKKDVIEAIRQASSAPSQEDVQAQIEQAVEEAKRQWQYELKQRELDLREKEVTANIDLVKAKQVDTGVSAAYSAMQGAVQVAQMPQIAPIADTIMQGAGYQRPEPFGDDPNFPAPAQAAAMQIRSPYIQGEGAQIGSEQIPEVQQNTSPASPPVPQQAESGAPAAPPMEPLASQMPESANTGIETPTPTDNI